MQVKARKAEASALAATDMLREMYEQISFLRVVTPRSPRDRRHIVGSSTYVVRDGELVEGIGNVKGKRYVPIHTGSGRISTYTLHTLTIQIGWRTAPSQ